jgi:hypothetical protein
MHNATPAARVQEFITVATRLSPSSGKNDRLAVAVIATSLAFIYTSGSSSDVPSLSQKFLLDNDCEQMLSAVEYEPRVYIFQRKIEEAT